MTEASASDKRPLDEVMLAMDVVDTVRHRQLLVERELNADDRDRRLIERLREIYAAQGIDVPDHVLAEGVTALREDRFTYKPPKPSLAVTLAQIYINRGKWFKRALTVVAVVAAVWVGYALLVSGPKQRRLEAIPRELTTQRQAIVAESKVSEVSARAEKLYANGMTALRDGDTKAAQNVVGELKALRAQLEQEYVLQIVSRPNERSGVWRLPERNPNARNYYIIVEAVTPNGEVLTLPITNEEDGRTYKVNKWGLRVDERVFRRIGADKNDDGIIQKRRFGVKRIGYLQPEYLMPTTGAAITDW
jgi:hypothetical protein